jgi:putative two-component system response regulator
MTFETHFKNGVSSLSTQNLLRSDFMRSHGSPARSTLLIVDSSAARRRGIATALHGLGCELLESRTTAEAIAAVAQRPVDLVIADISSPAFGGISLCRQIKDSPGTRFLPVLLVSRCEDPETEVLAINAGADAFLVGPPHPKVLRARVQASLRQKSVIDSLDETETVLFTLAQSVEERDPGLGQHCERLALMAAAMGASLGLPREDILALERGGYLHDVGKVAIPDSVLFKPGPLTTDEWTVMKSHAERGERICLRVRSLAPVLPIIRHHHERWDGTGYPDGLKGEEIPLLARILQLADIYDALIANRPYKRAFTPEEAVQIMREEAVKGWRDPSLVSTFADLLPMFLESTSDTSQMSLHALAASIDRCRKAPVRSEVHSTDEQVKMVSGL